MSGCVLYSRFRPINVDVNLVFPFLIGLIYAFFSLDFLARVRKEAVNARSNNLSSKSHVLWLVGSFFINLAIVSVCLVFICEKFLSITGVAVRLCSLLLALGYSLAAIKFIDLAKKQAADEHCRR